MAKPLFKWMISLIFLLTLGCSNPETQPQINPLSKFTLPDPSHPWANFPLVNMEDTFLFDCIDTAQNLQQVEKCLNAASYFYKEKSDEILREILPLVTSAELDLLNEVLVNMAAQDVRELQLSQKLAERRFNPEWSINFAHCVMHGNRSKFLYLRAIHHSLKAKS